MCYDLAFSNIKFVYDRFPELKEGPFAPFQPTFHKVAQSYPKWPVLTASGKLQLQLFEWGVIAPYMKTAEEIKKSRKWMVNARSEKVLDKKAFWYKIRGQRCLVPATGFFEHREVPGFKQKIPYFIQTKDAPLMLMAGLYSYSPLPDVETGELPGTFTIITRPANEVMGKIHNGGENAGRMPLILDHSMQEKWLEELSDEAIQDLLGYEMPSEQLDYWPVQSIRKPKEDNEQIIKPAHYEQLPGLDDQGGGIMQGELF
ncbi:DUF159 family protein [Chitinophaga caeni]|uniref:Abasic site processing protein n=1 Tax=Chitinophaga caeni TaxID=2029983 RepID=A0A291QUC5_9BACT|nr:SOS response-associated peptidase [Chitinophaga caeni]ATL47568.1 DUF159 family protein [Chitinophaga caeni]